MQHSIKKGFSFGLTSGIITTLGLMVGLHSSTHSALVIIGAIMIIAIADAMSDALGIHISEESENQHTAKQVWHSTLATFISKFVFALTFIVPVLIFPLNTAIIVSAIYGMTLISIFSYFMAKQQKNEPYKAVLEHLLIATAVIIVTHYIGDWVATFAV
jgi:VIT1/CCC1 family predicted Fe2+/Mn2+ transporter